MGLLDGGLQTMMGAAFAPQLLEGRHYQRAESRDLKGNASAAVTRVQSIKGYREGMSHAMREAGYPANTARLLILQTYQGRVIAKPNREDRVKLDGVTWVLGDLIDEDAAHVAWRFAATPE